MKTISGLKVECPGCGRARDWDNDEWRWAYDYKPGQAPARRPLVLLPPEGVDDDPTIIDSDDAREVFGEGTHLGGAADNVVRPAQPQAQPRRRRRNRGSKRNREWEQSGWNWFAGAWGREGGHDRRDSEAEEAENGRSVEAGSGSTRSPHAHLSALQIATGIALTFLDIVKRKMQKEIYIIYI